jgi:hypothetical protein
VVLQTKRTEGVIMIQSVKRFSGDNLQYIIFLHNIGNVLNRVFYVRQISSSFCTVWILDTFQFLLISHRKLEMFHVIA